MSEEMVTIPRWEYEKFLEALDDALFLQALQECGVDNWDGYMDACEHYEELKDEVEDQDEN